MPEPIDPRGAVIEPIHRALELLVLRGAASFAVAVLAVVVTIVPVGEQAAALGHLALPGVLAFVVLARVIHVARHHAPSGEGSWGRTHAMDPHETEFAAAVAIAVPVAWLVGGGAVLARLALDEPGLASVVAAWVPLGGLLWVAATVAWAGDCRERLTLALIESDRRFRSYWQSVGRSA